MTALWRVLQLGRSGRGRLVGAWLMGVIAAVAAVGLAGTSAWLIARAAERPPVLHLMVAIVAVRAAGISRGVFRYCERLLAHDASFRVLADLRVAVVRRLERLLPGSPIGRGDLLARFVADVDGLADLWVRVLLPAAVTLSVGTGAIVMVTVLLPAAGVVLAATFALGVFAVPAVAAYASRRGGARVAPVRGAAQRHLVSLLDGAAELTVYGGLDDAMAIADRLDDEVRAAEARTAWASGAAGALAILAAGAGLVAALWIGATAIADGSLSGPTLAVVVLLPLAVHELVAQVAPAAALLPQLAGAARRVLEVLDAPEVVEDPLVPADLPRGPFGVRASNLSVGWPGERPLLTSVSFEVTAGERIAIVGPSGSGKSTLAATMMGFIAPVAGGVSIVGRDGSVDLTDLTGDMIRSVIGWCSQDAHVFDSTVAANLRLARPDATDAELSDALGAVHLRDALHDSGRGLDTMVGEHGSSLSGGERQRLALARVVLSGAQVVVVDEPTEHLDDATARALLRDLLEVLRGRTVLVITHRGDLWPDDLRVLDLAGSPSASDGTLWSR